MTDILKIAEDKRRRLMQRIEDDMATVEELDKFIAYASRLSVEAGGAMEREPELRAVPAE